MSIFPSRGPRVYQVARLLLHRQHVRLEQSLENPMVIQNQVLKSIITNIGRSGFGREHGLAGVHDLEAYRTCMPIRTYQELMPWISRVLEGEAHALTTEHITGFVETSGTQSQPKLIPVTKSWSGHIREAQLLWVLGLLRDHPRISKGAIMHIVSPAAERLTDDGRPIGANTGRMVDALPSGLRRRFVLAGVPEIKNTDARIYTHLRMALEQPVTAWMTANPSTISLYARKFLAWEKWLRADLRNGTLREGPASMLDDQQRQTLELRLTVRPQPLDWRLGRIWPLSVIGCWTGGAAPFFTSQFSELLGADIPIRDVGITASEGYFGLPLHADWDGGVLWSQGELLEFEAADGRLFWGWELQTGEQYTLITSGRNGLLRYRMNDLVEVTGWYKQTPIIRFVGKKGRFLNATGEKVTEVQLAMAVQRVRLPVVGFTGFIEWLETPRIQLALEWTDVPDNIDACASHLDDALQAISTEYASKRRSMRLGCLRLVTVPAGTYERFRGERIAEGASPAQVKDCIIAKDEAEWRRIVVN